MVAKKECSPKVNVAVVGRFHAFNLAQELNAHGMLHLLQTTYPSHLTSRWGFKRHQTINEPHLELFSRVNRKLGLFRQSKADMWVHQAHAKRSAARLTRNADVFIGWSGSSLEALIAAREAGMTTILERGSSHCTTWRRLMLEESALAGEKFDMMYDFWQRELLEYELADYISIPSTFIRDTFVGQGVEPKKLLVNAYGVDLTSFRQVDRHDDRFRIITVGGFHLVKGSRYLLQAFAELNLPDAELWHVGTVAPVMRPFIEKYANDRVIFHGHKPQSELYKFYSQASVFVLMSIQEGMAMVQPQAMACGLPIICTTNTGGADLLGSEEEAGYVLPIRDVEGLKDRLLRLYENRELCREMGRTAKARIASGLTWADYGSRYAENIRQVTAARNKDKAAAV